jgi:hypothetical protein
VRRTTLPLVVVLVAALAGFTPAVAAQPVAAGAARPPPGNMPSARPPPAALATVPTGDVANEVDISIAIPALQAAFLERYGGYWIDEPTDIMHVAVVAATEADQATVSDLTGAHARVVTDSVTNGYDALVAAADEVGATLDPAAGSFSSGVDVRANAVVVQTEAASSGATETVARSAARRGGAEAAAEARRDRPRGRAAPIVPADVGDAVVIEPQASIDITTTGGTRNTFPAYEAGLNVTVHADGRLYGCTSGLLFHNAFGYFGSTAGHCGRIKSGVVMGPHIVDWIRINGYFGRSTVYGDAGLMSLSWRPWSAWTVVHTQGGGHRSMIGKLSNTQIAVGLGLCFEGRSSDGSNCGSVVRANQTICCDGYGKTYIYSCINTPGLAGDSGSPVFQRVGTTQARVAGMLSSTVTINGAKLMCFSTVANLERGTGSRVVTAAG